MPQDPSPYRGPDGPEPDGSGPLPADGTGPQGGGGTGPRDDPGGQGLFVCLHVQIIEDETGQAEAGYRPSRALQHLIRARNRRCTAPGCDRPAARCDLDRTLAWDQGGITCECDLAPSCMT
jgi:hypothetical protein